MALALLHSFLLSACATSGVKPLSSVAAPTIGTVDVVVEMPGVPVVQHGRVDLGEKGLIGVGANPAGMNQAQASSGSGMVGSIVATALIYALVSGDIEKQRKESEEIFANRGEVFASSYPRIAMQQALSSLQKRALDIPINSIAFVDDGDLAVRRPRDGNALLKITFHQSLSQDLSKLRLRMNAVAISPKGEELMREYFIFLPTSVDGETKEAVMETWAADDGKVYRKQIGVGVEAMVDALDISFFSYRERVATAALEDAQALLRKTHCYGGDFDVGIPMDAYSGGSILARRDRYSVVRIKNGSVLTFPACT